MNAINSDPARKRFLTIQAVRTAGVVMVLLGMLVLRGEIDWHPAIGWVLLINGMADVFVVPLLLTRRWRSPRP